MDLQKYLLLILSSIFEMSYFLEDLNLLNHICKLSNRQGICCFFPCHILCNFISHTGVGFKDTGLLYFVEDCDSF